MRCPICLNLAVRTNWLPPSGMEPFLREYKCAECRRSFFARTGRKQKVQKEVLQ